MLLFKFSKFEQLALFLQFPYIIEVKSEVVFFMLEKLSEVTLPLLSLLTSRTTSGLGGSEFGTRISILKF